MPTTREEQTFNPIRHSKQPINQQEQDWNKIKQEINQRIQQAITSINKVKAKSGFFRTRHLLRMCLKVQEWKTKWVLVIVTLKLNLKATSTRPVSLMKAEQGDKLQARPMAQNQNPTKAVEMLQGEEQRDWSMFLYSL